MTLPDERYRAVTCTKKFLLDLAFDRVMYPRLSREVRDRAKAMLRHYPSDYEMDVAAHYAPDVFCKENWYEQRQKELNNGKAKQSI